MSKLNLQDFTAKSKWTPRSEFPPSDDIGGRIFSCGDGFYLLTNPKRGDGDPVYAAGWARSDYWALRSWSVPPFSGNLAEPPKDSYGNPPSLAFLGRPEDLSFGKIKKFEKSKLGPDAITMITARYRMTDGAFLYLSLSGADGITYAYSSNEPRSGDMPVSISLDLPGSSRISRLLKRS